MEKIGPSILEKEPEKVATLEDTFRMMKGDEPVNTEKLSVSETTHVETKSMIMNNCDGKPKGKVTSEFLDSVRDTLAEHRGEKVNEAKAPADPKDVKAYRDGLVDAGKKIVASLNAINLDHPGKAHDLNTLNDIEGDMKQLMSHLQMFPEIRSYIKGKIKLPSRPKRQKRGF
jgi:hypothetical protein